MKNKNIEIKIYELLGIKIFKKVAIGFVYILFYPFLLKIPKSERKEVFYNFKGNYFIKKGHGIQDLKDFKKYLLFNAIVHIVSLLFCIPSFICILIGNASLIETIIMLPCIIINSYCIMLQRYNQIRINNTIEKMKLHEEKKKKALALELI